MEFASGQSPGLLQLLEPTDNPSATLADTTAMMPQMEWEAGLVVGQSMSNDGPKPTAARWGCGSTPDTHALLLTITLVASHGQNHSLWDGQDMLG